MKAPIPEPGAAPQESGLRGPRPAVLTYFIAIDLVVTALSIHYFEPATDSAAPTLEKLAMVLFSLIWIWGLYMLWTGANWARIVLIIGCVLGLSSLFWIEEESTVNQYLTAFSAVLSCAWIVFLLSRPARAFTRGNPEEQSLPDGHSR